MSAPFHSKEDENLAIYENIVQSLLEAGYFRVQMATLSPFDKVVGGLTWCITWMGLDVDLGDEVLRFKEDANIGYKIALSEKLNTVLVKLGFTLEPHQIQGLDYPNLHSIITVLLKSVREIRSKYGDFHSRYAKFLFDKRFLPSTTSAIDIPFEKLTISKTPSPQMKRQPTINDSEELKELKLLESMLKETQQIIEDRQSTKTSLEQELEELQKQRKSISEQDETLETEIQKLFDEWKRSEKECTDFQANCKAELKDIKRQIKKYESHNTETDEQADHVLSSLQEQMLKLHKLKMKTSQVQRELNQIPHSLELQQCQKRFMELYQMMSKKLVELRQRYTTYNYLESVQTQLGKEVALLKSVYENIVKTSKSKTNQDKLIASLEQWLQAAVDNQLKTEAKCQEAKEMREKIAGKHEELVELQQKYYRAISEFHHQLHLNDELHSKKNQIK